jgi:hypothetical protein
MSNSRFNKLIINDEYFWQQKYHQDCKIKICDQKENWKSLYKHHIIWGFGANNDGQLGVGPIEFKDTLIHIPNIKAKQISTRGFHTIMIDLNDDIWSFGDNKSGQLGLGDTQNRNIPT